MKRRHFRIFYFCFLGVAIALGALAALYVFFQLKSFERSQPEYLLKAAVGQMQRACADDTLDTLLTVPQDLQGGFSKGGVIYEEYKRCCRAMICVLLIKRAPQPRTERIM